MLLDRLPKRRTETIETILRQLFYSGAGRDRILMSVT